MSDPKKIKLRVTRRHHTFGGKTYKAGETFMGTEKMLKAMPDRLQLASAPVDQSAASADAAKALADAEKGRDLYKAAADEAQAELGEVKQKLADAEAELAKLKASASAMPSPGAKSK